MKPSKRFVALLLTVFIVLGSTEAKKKAFTVFIGDYPESSGWSKIHSSNDKPIVLETLIKNGFPSENIIAIEESAATYGAITQALHSFVESCQLGDEIYVHFSCHGQWITDIDGDEKLRNPRDCYDESLIPYDAQIAYNWRGYGYSGEHHFVDDELNRYISDIERRIGRKGCLMVVIDACHSGDSQRLYLKDDEADEDYLYRGSKDAFERPIKDNSTQAHSESIDCLIITACHDFESNYECTVDGVMYGRLSYAISKAWESGMNQESLRDAVEQEYGSLMELSPLPKNRTQWPTFVLSKKYAGRKLF